MPSGKWKSQVVGKLNKAEKVEAKFKTEAVDEKVFAIPGKCPTIEFIWGKYLKWAKANKSSWRDDQGRWLKHVKPHLGRKRMDRITAKDIHKILDIMSEAGWNRPERKEKNRSKTYRKPPTQPYSPATTVSSSIMGRRGKNSQVDSDRMKFQVLSHTTSLDQHFQTSLNSAAQNFATSPEA